MTSASTFTQRLTRIDDLTRPDHWYLTSEDECYFLGEYTARKGYAYSATNNLMLNFKKPMDRRGRPEWRYKEEAIRQAAEAFRRTLDPEALERLTFVPIPPSKAKNHPLHDDRLTRTLRAMQGTRSLDIRELVVQTQSTDPVHDQEVRPRPTEIGALYSIDETLSEPEPPIIALVDDLLTTGAHYRAAHSILSTQFPDCRILGLFIARRVPNTADLEDFEGSPRFRLDSDACTPLPASPGEAPGASLPGIAP